MRKLSKAVAMALHGRLNDGGDVSAGRDRPIPTRCRSIRAVLIAGALQAFGCSSPCDNEVISSRLSPDGQLNAVVFIRSCGATTPVVTEVSVLPADAGVPEGWANAVTLSDDPEHPVQRSTEAIQVLLKWDSRRRLRVSFPQAAVAQKRASKVKDVAIVYSTF